MPEPTSVAVVGSANLDIVIELDATPQPGETVLGRSYSEHGGGKGHNQAIAAAALVRTAFIGAVGTDAAGNQLLENMAAYGVDVRCISRSALPSGRAFITLTPDGENSIVVVAGASRALAAPDVTSSLEALQPAIVVAQHEIASSAVEAAADWARANDRRFLFNASPVAPLAAFVMATADPLIVNASEAMAILGVGVGVGSRVEAALAEQLLEVSASVIVTAGRRGAYVADRASGVTHVPASTVDAIDTTGAGDAFAGTVAAALAAAESLVNSARRGATASAGLISVPRRERKPAALAD